MQIHWFKILDMQWNKIEQNHMHNFELLWQLHLNMNLMNTSSVVRGASMLSSLKSNGRIWMFKQAVNCAVKFWMHICIWKQRLHELFTTDKNLQMLNHEFDCQKNEAMNKAFTKIAAKTWFSLKPSHWVIDYVWQSHMICLATIF